jgi:hypothetical protein
MYQVISKFVVAKVDRVKEGDLTTICQVHPTVPGPKTITLNQASFVGFVAFIFNSFSGTAVMFFYFAKKEKKNGDFLHRMLLFRQQKRILLLVLRFLRAPLWKPTAAISFFLFTEKINKVTFLVQQFFSKPSGRKRTTKPPFSV